MGPLLRCGCENTDQRMESLWKVIQLLKSVMQLFLLLQRSFVNLYSIEYSI